MGVGKDWIVWREEVESCRMMIGTNGWMDGGCGERK